MEEIEIVITYELNSANGFPVQHRVVAYSVSEAEEYFQLIEKAGYKLIDARRGIDDGEEDF